MCWIFHLISVKDKARKFVKGGNLISAPVTKSLVFFVSFQRSRGYHYNKGWIAKIIFESKICLLFIKEHKVCLLFGFVVAQDVKTLLPAHVVSIFFIWFLWCSKSKGYSEYIAQWKYFLIEVKLVNHSRHPSLLNPGISSQIAF